LAPSGSSTDIMHRGDLGGQRAPAGRAAPGFPGRPGRRRRPDADYLAGNCARGGGRRAWARGNR
jgi:hypothetical protein